MKKTLLFTIIAGLQLTAFSQTADFETPLSQADTAWFGQDQVIDGDTTFTTGGLTFENNYNASWFSFTGWAYSNSVDVTTAGYGNQFSAIPGSGQNNSNQFGLCYVNGNNRMFAENGAVLNLSGTYITNTTYAYLSMTDGDAYAKKFGENVDANGTVDGTNGEDWFLLTIYGLGADSTYTGDSINFYLADYRFADSADDYIVKDWEYVDLTTLGSVYGLDFKLSSSDEGTWGMNTPAYFAMDNLTGGYASVSNTKETVISIYPNPSEGIFYLNTSEQYFMQVIDMTGKVIIEKQTTGNNKELIDLSNVEKGMYFIHLKNANEQITKRIIKQ
ncbi:hypothetical protein DNU06_00755 [Putridiphycobacter roseus]|uniref:Secretion system C-terminal sorting domain-containing protein n=1 Tax=Putridiphycobacter roseus TaxID=2219161 RepID=A0A2W1N1B0_9FLAO|nr:DUF4465 domain-containing protein [Putridiphycobacter roseus]PZE18399.1 hypothetical protein DNU06_00755 [Putridiphycobacter roseus]